MLKTRRFQLSNAQQDLKFGRIPPKQFYFWDRSLIGDYIFALWNHLLGGISKEEMVVYEDGTSSPHLVTLLLEQPEPSLQVSFVFSRLLDLLMVLTFTKSVDKLFPDMLFRIWSKY